MHKFASAQVVVGGCCGTLSSVELFPLPTSNDCKIPDLPHYREDHTLSLLSGGRLVVCGGSYSNCYSWAAGDTSWSLLYNMGYQRSLHVAWTPPSLPDSIVLFGGSPYYTNAEILPGNSSIYFAIIGN